MFRTETTTGAYASLVRFIAVLAALCFTLVTVTASVHHHGDRYFAPQAHSAPVTATVSGVPQDSPATPSLTNADCVLCDWLLTAATPMATIPLAVAIAFSAAVALLFSVRLAALCSRPAPRRGLRAPPLAATA